MPQLTLRDQLLRLAGVYCEASGRSPARISTLIHNQGGWLGRLERGGDLTTGTWEKAVRWFADNWPADLAWPDGVSRPTRTVLIGNGERRTEPRAERRREVEGEGAAKRRTSRDGILGQGEGRRVAVPEEAA